MTNLYANPIRIAFIVQHGEKAAQTVLPQKTYLSPNEWQELTGKLTPTDYMVAELYPNLAPNTVKNFVSLIKKGFYNGLIFHRVIKDFMIQGGCPQGNGMGGPNYCIKGEFKQNGVANPLCHSRGVLSMARAMHPNSAGSQFFIMHADAPHLDGQYAAFGRLVEGEECLDNIAETKVDYQDKPLAEQKILQVYLLDQVDLEEPEKCLKR